MQLSPMLGHPSLITEYDRVPCLLTLRVAISRQLNQATVDLTL